MADSRRGSAKQNLFIEAYNGNIEEAAKAAGITYQYARRLATRSNIKKALKERENQIKNPLIADRNERQAFWTKVFRDKNENMKNRLRAAELLGKSNADFIDRIEHSGEATTILTGPGRYKEPEEWQQQHKK